MQHCKNNDFSEPIYSIGFTIVSNLNFASLPEEFGPRKDCRLMLINDWQFQPETVYFLFGRAVRRVLVVLTASQPPALCPEDTEDSLVT
jgi:hypothetical protein